MSLLGLELNSIHFDLAQVPEAGSGENGKFRLEMYFATGPCAQCVVNLM